MELPKQYPLAVATALAINLHCYTQAWTVGAARRKLFNQEFMSKTFGEKHQTQLGEQIVAGGYPDAGSGVYSQNLSYADWYRFNVLQRIHLNYVENVSLVTTSVLAAGLYRPRTAAYLGVTYIIGRILYSIFYKKKGGALNKGRLAGVIISYIGLIGAIGVFGVNFWKNHIKA